MRVKKKYGEWAEIEEFFKKSKERKKNEGDERLKRYTRGREIAQKHEKRLIG